LFAGYIYRMFADQVPGQIGSRIPINRSVIITAFFFSLWHLPSIFYGMGSYIWFQLIYTFFGACLAGLVRQWTGSIIYITVVHMIVNYIAVIS
ncbi:MAG: CPBP family intramembrane glutamic endopeptidase, partial [Planctomycetota bacterium]